jgi:hypothetical protein
LTPLRVERVEIHREMRKKSMPKVAQRRRADEQEFIAAISNGGNKSLLRDG